MCKGPEAGTEGLLEERNDDSVVEKHWGGARVEKAVVEMGRGRMLWDPAEHGEDVGTDSNCKGE